MYDKYRTLSSMTSSQDKAQEAYFANFYKIIELHQVSQSNEKDLETLIRTLENELVLSRGNEKASQDRFVELLRTCNDSSLMKYTLLKKKEDLLIDENERLKTELDNLNEKLKVERMSLENHYFQEISATEEKWKREIEKVDNELRSSREKLEKREQELYNEIQMVQAASAMQCDEMEAKYLQQISSLNDKLRDANISCSKLRSDNHNLKAQYTIQLNNKDKKISELEKRLQNAQNILQEMGGRLQSEKENKRTSLYDLSTEILEVENIEMQEKDRKQKEFKNIPSNLFPSTSTVAGKNVSNEKNKNQTDVSLRYRPLEVMTKSLEEDDFVDDNFTYENKSYLPLPSKKTLPTIYKAGQTGKNEVTRSVLVPPLKQCSDAMNNKDFTSIDIRKNIGKKRRLYDPNDLSYLENLGDTE